MLTGCILKLRAADLAPDIPPDYGAGNGDVGAAGARLVARLSLARADRSDRGGADRQSRHRGRHRAHHAGRRAGQDRRRAAAAGGRLRPAPRTRVAAAGRPGAQRSSRPRSTPATRSISGARTAPPRAPRRRPRSPPASTKEVVVLSTVVSVGNAYFQVLAAQDRLRIARQNLAAANRVLDADQAAVRGRHRLRSSTSRSRRAWSRPGAREHPAVRPDAAPEHRHAGGADRPRRRSRSWSRAAASIG